MDCVVSEHLVVRFSLKFLPFSAHLLLFSDYSEAFRSIESSINNLRLEWEARHLGQVYFLHREQVVQRLQPVLEGKDTIYGDVPELAGQKRFVIREILLKLVAELQGLVQLDLGFYLGGDHWLSKHVGKILRQGSWIHPLDLSTGKISQFAEGVNVTLITFD